MSRLTYSRTQHDGPGPITRLLIEGIAIAGSLLVILVVAAVLN